jgi:methyl-accepting chemotaxis protein
MILGMLAIQVDAASIEALERIAFAQMVVAAVMVIIGLIAIGGAFIVLLELRSARRLLHNLTDTVSELKPRVAPLVDRAIHVTSDVSAMMDNIRRRVDDVLFTVEELNRAAKRGSAATEDRIKRFGAVLDMVQTEAEDLLLDAASTARGVHETARQLREPARPVRRRPVRPIDDDDIEEILE